MILDEVVLKLVIKCNMNCPTCNERRSLYRNIGENIEMPYDKWIDIINQIYDLGCRRIGFSGGETLLYHNLIDIIKYCHNKGFYTSLNTNGLLLKKELSDELFNSGIDNICISYNNYNVKNYLLAHGINNSAIYDKIVDNIKYFNNNKPSSIVVNDVIFITKLNMIELSSLIYKAREYKFNAITFDFLEGNYNDNSFRVNSSDIEKYLRNGYKILGEKHKKIMDKIINVLYKNTYRSDNGLTCDIPGKFCIILPNGELHSCNVIEYTHEKRLNLYDYNFSIKNLFDSDEMKYIIKKRSLYCNRCPMQISEKIRFY